jgi:protein SEY1
VDGFPLYARQCWEQIIANKDLDLPTQQVLLAQYRCDEIAQTALTTFDGLVKPLEAGMRTDTILLGLGEKMDAARRGTLDEFENQAQRYHKDTFRRKLEELRSTVDLRLHGLFRGQITALHSLCVKRFEEGVEIGLRRGESFSTTVKKVKDAVVAEFDREARAVMIEETDWTFALDRELLLSDVESVTCRLRKEEILRVIEKVEKVVKSELEEPVALAFASPDEIIWDRIMETFTVIKSAKGETFRQTVEGELGASKEDVEDSLINLRGQMWGVLRDRLEGECEPTHLLLRLRESSGSPTCGRCR